MKRCPDFSEKSCKKSSKFHLTLSQTTNFRLFQTYTVYKYDERSRMFSKRVENTVGKGEIAHCQQFLLFPHCFQKTCTADM